VNSQSSTVQTTSFWQTFAQRPILNHFEHASEWRLPEPLGPSWSQ